MKLKALVSMQGAADSRARAGSEFSPEDLGMSAADIDVAVKRGFVEIIADAPAPATADAPAAGEDKPKKAKAAKAHADAPKAPAAGDSAPE